MRRREFITLLGGAAAWSLPARAQQAGKVWRIGFLFASTPASYPDNHEGFRQGMRALGYIEGADFIMEPRYAGGQYERLPDLAAELVRQKVDVIITAMSPAVRAAQQATGTLPIIIAGVLDPVGQGFVASLGRPGGNITGLTGSYDDSSPKQLELLTAIVPSPSRIGFLVNPENSATSPQSRIVRDAARKVGIAIVLMEARGLNDLENAFETLAREDVRALIVAPDPALNAHRLQIAHLALHYRLPTMSSLREFVEVGGLMSYGESSKEFLRRSAGYVDKIIKGAKPADLPVEQPTRFYLVINRKTADALGVAIPPSLYIFADEVIE